MANIIKLSAGQGWTSAGFTAANFNSLANGSFVVGTSTIDNSTNLDLEAEFSGQWTVGGTPVTSLMNIERRKGKNKPVIKKKLVDLEDAPFQTFRRYRDSWILADDYRVPGPIQHAGPTNVVIHEFVHKLDMADGEADGCPPMPAAARARVKKPQLRISSIGRASPF